MMRLIVQVKFHYQASIDGLLDSEENWMILSFCTYSINVVIEKVTSIVCKLKKMQIEGGFIAG